MIQKKWFRIETDVSGAIISCAEVDSKGKQGAVVRYYEALTKADACKQAKEWYASRKKWIAKNVLRRRAIVKDGGCRQCSSPRGSAGTSNFCRRCADELARRQREMRAGTFVHTRGPQADSAESAFEKHKNNLRSKAERIAKIGGSGAARLLGTLRQFDQLGPDRFRSKLCERIRVNGGGATLDEYERERAKKADDAFADAAARYQERHPEAAE
jgi:hypothetical protein